MTDEPRKTPARSQVVAQVVFGVGGTIASTVYGTVVVMATVTAAYATEKDPWKLAVLVMSTVLVLWVAHLHAHGISESIEKGRLLRRADMAAIARRELGILLAAAAPTAALVLGAVGLLRETSAVWVALGICLLTLGAEGVRYARLERLGGAGTLFATGVNLALGLAVVALKVALAH